MVKRFYEYAFPPACFLYHSVCSDGAGDETNDTTILLSARFALKMHQQSADLCKGGSVMCFHLPSTCDSFLFCVFDCQKSFSRLRLLHTTPHPPRHTFVPETSHDTNTATFLHLRPAWTRSFTCFSVFVQQEHGRWREARGRRGVLLFGAVARSGRCFREKAQLEFVFANLGRTAMVCFRMMFLLYLHSCALICRDLLSVEGEDRGCVVPSVRTSRATSS